MRVITTWTLLLAIVFLLPEIVRADDGASGLLVSPLSLDFGPVVLGETTTQVVRISNSGPKKADLDDLELRFSRDLRYFSADDGCPEELKNGAGCEIAVSFTPLTTGEQAGELRIDLDDDLLARISLAASAVRAAEPPVTEPPVTKPLSPSEPPTTDPPSAGEPVVMGKIVILDTFYPPDIGDVDFGDVPVGLAKRRLVKVRNEGPGELVLGIIEPGILGEVFELRGLAENRNHCSEKVLRRNQECTVMVAFRPEAEGEHYAASLSIPYADAGQIAFESARVELRGSGGAATDAFPAPVLIHPEPDQPHLKSSVRFRWYNCRDATGQEAAYRLYCSLDPAFDQTLPKRVGTVVLSALGTGSLLATGLLLPARRRRGYLLASVLLLTAALLACSDDVEDSSTGSVSALEGGETYHWKVVAEYDDGLEAQSEVRTFSTR
ncbi:MAG: choice-of-anchor D domain-containing protein [Desulfuromonadales bacterium]|nr:choice-of-anchor D domain-containing protein [Desulfuromonadales bacterium]